MKKILFLIFPFLINSCAFFKHGFSENISTGKIIKKYSLKDQSGDFIVNRESGYNSKKKIYIVKRKVYSKNNLNKEFEKSISISEYGYLKKQSLLRPKISQYSVWFEGKKYFTEMKIDIKTKSLVVKMKSPEEQWSGVQNVPFPKGTGVYCFMSQIIECVRATKFISMATSKGGGRMNFHLIFDGYPYFQEQYLNIPKTVFTNATFVYDGKAENGERRFSLMFGEQTIFYFVNDKSELSKTFWVSQGLSMITNK